MFLAIVVIGILVAVACAALLMQPKKPVPPAVGEDQGDPPAA